VKISKDARKLAKELFRLSFTNGKLDRAKMEAIVSKISQSKPRYYIDILKEYQRLARLEVQKRHAVIESATTLDYRLAEQLERDLRAKYGSDLTTEFRVTPDLIGGMRIKLGSNVWDSTVRGRLDRLKTQLASP
jgi:F-type H+-transporting ATPase subunit delta